MFSETEDLLLSIEKAEENVKKNDDDNEVVGDIIDNLVQKAVATQKIDFEEKVEEQQIPEKLVKDVHPSHENKLDDPVEAEEPTTDKNDASNVKTGAEEIDSKIIPRRSKRLAEKYREEVQKVRKINEED